jgi:hypothetical protein
MTFKGQWGKEESQDTRGEITGGENVSKNCWGGVLAKVDLQGQAVSLSLIKMLQIKI